MTDFLFNFKSQFADMVAAGEKYQTVRAIRKDGRLPRINDIAKCYTGLRTRNARLLIAAPITRVSIIVIDFRENTIALDEGRLGFTESTRFAQADGFASVATLLEWFRANHKVAATRGPHLFEGFVTWWNPTERRDV